MNSYLKVNYLEKNAIYMFSAYVRGFELGKDIVICKCTNTHFKVLEIKRHNTADNIIAICQKCRGTWYFRYYVNRNIAQIIFKKVVKV